MIKYAATTGGLYNEKKQLLKLIKCPLQKSWGELQSLDWDVEPKLRQYHKYIERHRYCDACQSNVMNIDELNEDQIEGACLGNPDICLHGTLPHPAIEVIDEGASPNKCPSIYWNTHDLRVIHTARNLAAMNEAAEKGFWPLIVPVKPSESVRNKMAIAQKEDGTIQISSDYRSPVGYSENIYWTNPYRSPLPIAVELH